MVLATGLETYGVLAAQSPPTLLAFVWPATAASVKRIHRRFPLVVSKQSNRFVSRRGNGGVTAWDRIGLHGKRCRDGPFSTRMVAAVRDGASAKDLESAYPVQCPAASKLVEFGLDEDGWRALLSIGNLVSLSESEPLMIQGEQPENPGDREVYLLLDGECSLEVKGSEAVRVGPGEFIGEASFTSGKSGPRSATVRARGPGRVEAIAWTTRELRSFTTDTANLNVTVALQACWMAGLAGKLTDVMLALAGDPIVSAPREDDEVGAGDYGYRYPEDMREVESVVPVSSFRLAWWNFAREYRALRRTFRFGEFKNTWIAGPFALIDRFLETSVFPELRPSRVDLPRDPTVVDLQKRLAELKLSNEEIAQREITRIENTRALLQDQARKGLSDADILLRSQTPWFVMLPYRALCWFLDVIFEDRPIQRFWFLETVARMPYFSYLSMLHVLETLGWWTGSAEVRRVHFAEEYNEMQHLRIMESLGGDVLWSDRFLARHAAIVYYWVLILGYVVSPFLAYNFSELIESHAVDTYSVFIETNKELLKSLPPSAQALQYYRSGDMFLFDEFQTSRPAFSRRPVIKNLYDVFIAIRDDELEHVKTMFACERGTGDLVSPNKAASTPRWAEDAPRVLRKSPAGTVSESTALRSDIARKSPLETLYSATSPLIGWGITEEKGKGTSPGAHVDAEDGHGPAENGSDVSQEAETDSPEHSPPRGY